MVAQKKEKKTKKYDIVFEEYKKKVADITDSDKYFENTEKSSSRDEQLEKRQPNTKYLQKINRLTSFQDLPIESTATLQASDTAKWLEQHEDELDRAENNFDKEIAEHSVENPRIEKLYHETIEDRDRLKEELSAARVSLRTQAEGLKHNTFNKAKIVQLGEQAEKRDR